MPIILRMFCGQMLAGNEEYRQKGRSVNGRYKTRVYEPWASNTTRERVDFSRTIGKLSRGRKRII